MRAQALLGILAILLVASAGQSADELPLGIVKERPQAGHYVEIDQGFMVPYKTTIPGTSVQFEMVPIPPGKLMLGSPASEAGRRKDEGPQFQVSVPAGWMGKHEIRWEEYNKFMDLYRVFKEFETNRVRLVTDERKVDAITAPTELYDPSFTFKYGEDPQLPAVTMTQYAAKQYTKWLSQTSGLFYRLPSEAEWEHACRAGTNGPYSFGDSPEKLGEYAWFKGNSDEQPHKIGLKKPNPWGLHDIHGNVAEWVLDEKLDDGFGRFAGKQLTAADALVWPKKLYPRVIRGGSWMDPAAGCRSAARLGSSDEEWKGEDPNIPLSPWWFTNDPARAVGFRLYRPLAAPKRDERERYWKADVEEIVLDVESRLIGGRGALGIVDPSLPNAIKKLDD